MGRRDHAYRPMRCIQPSRVSGNATHVSEAEAELE